MAFRRSDQGFQEIRYPEPFDELRLTRSLREARRLGEQLLFG
jgi:hypothetical protein